MAVTPPNVALFVLMVRNGRQSQQVQPVQPSMADVIRAKERS